MYGQISLMYVCANTALDVWTEKPNDCIYVPIQFLYVWSNKSHVGMGKDGY